jgi:hypothetical protein
MNNHGHGNAYGWLLLYGNALVLVGFHIDFALVLAVAPVQKKKII